MQLNELGEIVWDCWQAIPNHFPHVQLDQFVIMPNHIHGIIIIPDPRRGMALPCPNNSKSQQPISKPNQQIGKSKQPIRKFRQPIAGSLPTIIGSFKSAVTKQINLRDTPKTPVWQRNYYEHIIRNQASLQHIQQYIQNNPLSWNYDRLHPDQVNC